MPCGNGEQAHSCAKRPPIQRTAGATFDSFKTCIVAVEWANQRQLEREHLERIQNGVRVPGAGC
jgi:hypothetical protein